MKKNKKKNQKKEKTNKKKMRVCARLRLEVGGEKNQRKYRPEDLAVPVVPSSSPSIALRVEAPLPVDVTDFSFFLLLLLCRWHPAC